MEVNSNGKIVDGVNHCYTFAKVNNENILFDDDFPCPLFANNYDYISTEDQLPYLGGGSTTINGTVKIRRFEWLDAMMPTTSLARSITQRTITIPDKTFDIENHIGNSILH